LVRVFLVAIVLSVVVRPNTAAAPISGNDTAVVLPIEVVTAADSMVGFTRTRIEPGGSYRFSTGSGPSFQFVEYGLLSLGSQFASLTHVSTMPGTPPDGNGLEAGTAFVIGAGSSLDLRNDSPKPVIVLQLLAAADATRTGEIDVSHQVLMQQAYQLPSGLVALTLRRTELAPGAQIDRPAGMATIASFASIDLADTGSLTVDGINRGLHLVAVYVLTVTSIRSDVAPPVHPV
jgi:hypothetical protein